MKWTLSLCNCATTELEKTRMCIESRSWIEKYLTKSLMMISVTMKQLKSIRLQIGITSFTFPLYANEDLLENRLMKVCLMPDKPCLNRKKCALPITESEWIRAM